MPVHFAQMLESRVEIFSKNSLHTRSDAVEDSVHLVRLLQPGSWNERNIIDGRRTNKRFSDLA